MLPEADVLAFNLFSGLLIGSFYGITALGLNFIFGVLNFVNSAHGDFIMLGAYITYWLFVLFAVPPPLSIILTFAVGFGLGVLIFALIVKRLINAPMIYSLIAAFGLSILLQELAKFVWGPSYRGFSYDMGYMKLLDFTIPQTRLFSAAISIVIVSAFYFFLFKTRFGRAIRSVMQSPSGAVLCGVNVNKVFMTAFALGIGVTTLGGTLLTFFVSSGINPYMGGTYTNIGFVIAVLGGLGSPEGALIGGLLYGAIESVTYQLLSYVPSINPFSMTEFISFAILLLILLVRPKGLLGR